MSHHAEENRHDGEVAQNVALFEIDRLLDDRVRWLRFPPAIAAQFEADSGRARSRQLMVQSTIGLVMLNLFLAIDWLIIRDVMWLAIGLRTVVMGVAGAVFIWLLSRNPAPFVREGLGAILSTAALVILVVLMAASQSPLRTEYHYGLLVVVMFTVMLLRVRFWYAVGACVVALLVQQAGLNVAGPIAWETRATATALMMSAITFALMAGYALERDERMNYLRGLRERMRVRKYRALSQIDPLTGLGNRRALEQFMQAFASRAGSSAPLALILTDIDHFKPYNDHYGHLAGDACLQRIAAILVAEAEAPGGEVFRFGGEEFIIVLPGFSQREAERVAETMRQEVVEAAIPHVVPAVGACVTLSFGVSSSAAHEPSTTAALIGRADSALYAAKGGGRNRIGGGRADSVRARRDPQQRAS